ncbi:unnamed protein product [Parnassius apollo]|uniref:(apollo) hypothetical protein n=1 Tax=Parnassius apollo TaxID=110799 RepID=A0A8S3XAL8_PARAO|nr:unnamed protein product [Parnassius apollo]
MSDYEEFVDFVEYARRFREPGPRRYLRDYSDPFQKYTVQEFYSRYRFIPQAIKNTIMPMLEPHLKKPSSKGLLFAPEIMILVTLRYYATGSFQMGMGIKKETVVAVICACATLHDISTMLDDVMMPSTDDNILISNIDNVPVQENPDSNGFLVRQSVVNRFFSQ